MRVVNAIAVALLLVFACARNAEPEIRDPHSASQLAAAPDALLPPSLHRRDGVSRAFGAHNPLFAVTAPPPDAGSPHVETLASLDEPYVWPHDIFESPRSSRGPPRRSRS